MKKSDLEKKLPIGEEIWFYDEKSKRIVQGYLYGVIFSERDNPNHNEDEFIISHYVIKTRWCFEGMTIPRWLCFFTWKEVLNFIAENCELPLAKENDTNEEN